MNAGAAPHAPRYAQLGLLGHINLIWVMTWMNFLPRSARDSLRLFWVIAEPAGQLAIMMVIFSMIGRVPGYGESFPFFLLTGIVMLTLYRQASTMVQGAVLGLSARTRLATIGLFHAAIARLLFNVVVAVVYTTLLAYGLGIIEGIDVAPAHPLIAAEAFVWAAILAFGVGLLRAAAAKFVPTVDRVYGVASRGLLFISGIFYVPSFMAPQIRDLLFYNPVMHLIELFRLGMYAEYPTIIYSPWFLKGFALASVGFGMAILWARRRDFLG